jgi:hypothetical protein
MFARAKGGRALLWGALLRLSGKGVSAAVTPTKGQRKEKAQGTQKEDAQIPLRTRAHLRQDQSRTHPSFPRATRIPLWPSPATERCGFFCHSKPAASMSSKPPSANPPKRKLTKKQQEEEDERLAKGHSDSISTLRSLGDPRAGLSSEHTHAVSL